MLTNRNYTTAPIVGGLTLDRAIVSDEFQIPLYFLCIAVIFYTIAKYVKVFQYRQKIR